MANTTNDYFYKPSLGASGTSELALFDAALDATDLVIKDLVDNKQPLDAGLTSIAGLTTAANKMIYTTGLDVYAAIDLTAFARSILDDADEATFKATVNLEIGTDVLAEQTIGIANDNLVEIDDADAAANDYCRLTANGIVGRSYSEVRTDLGLVIGTNVAASGGNSDITALTGLTTALGANYGGTGVLNNALNTITFTGNYTLGLTLTANTSITLPTSGTLATTALKLSAFAATTSAELAGIISNETGSGALVFGTSPTFITPTLGVATATSYDGILAANLLDKSTSYEIITGIDWAFQSLASDNALKFTNYSDNIGHESTFAFRTSHQNTVGFTSTIDNERLGGFAWYGNNGTTWKSGARLRAQQDGVMGNYIPTGILIQTSDGTNVWETALYISKDKRIGITTESPSGNLDINAVTDADPHFLLSENDATKWDIYNDHNDDALQVKAGATLRYEFHTDGTANADVAWGTFSPVVEGIGKELLAIALEDANKPVKPYEGIPIVKTDDELFDMIPTECEEEVNRLDGEDNLVLDENGRPVKETTIKIKDEKVYRLRKDNEFATEAEKQAEYDKYHKVPAKIAIANAKYLEYLTEVINELKAEIEKLKK